MDHLTAQYNAGPSVNVLEHTVQETNEYGIAKQTSYSCGSIHQVSLLTTPKVSSGISRKGYRDKWVRFADRMNHDFSFTMSVVVSGCAVFRENSCSQHV
ncbi:hypothetical protein TNCV_4519711 [Trichonephila clavipes]|nr:hypothetical protein TNCV_4519711 [Trichonephila clavipes]